MSLGFARDCPEPSPQSQAVCGCGVQINEASFHSLDSIWYAVTSCSFVQRLSSIAPLDYVTPPFPGLYWPFPVRGTQANYLYHPEDIWRFTLLWTIILFEAVHMATSGHAVIMQWRSWKIVWVIPVLYAVVGGIEAVIAGSVVGGL